MRLILLLLFCALTAWGQTYTEFYCQTTADNLNAGSTKEDSANTSYAGGTFVRATGVFTVASGNPTSDTGVTNGAWASIYTTSGATIATCVGRITNTSANTLTIDIGTVSGATANVSETAAAATAKVGGAWKGPNAAVGLPFGFIATNSINSANVFPRVNFKNGVNYAITAAMTHSLNGPVMFQGYTTNPGDGGRATIDGGTSGTSYILLNVTGVTLQFADLIFSNNGASGSANGVSIAGSRATMTRCVFKAMRLNGASTGSAVMISCEFYGNNLSNSGGSGGCSASSGSLINCNFHDNSTAKSHGIIVNGSSAAPSTLINCIASFNGSNGVYVLEPVNLINCDMYSNGGAGIENATAFAQRINIINCNFLKNGNFGISNSLPLRVGVMRNCGFGSGTEANGGTDTVNMGSMSVSGSFTYPANTTPYANTANENFTLKSGTLARAGGYSQFTETDGSHSGTLAYPDVGAAQSASTNTPGSWTFSQ